jgi:hypothetical protein
MGSQDSQSSSAPVSAEDRLKTYNAGMGAMFGSATPKQNNPYDPNSLYGKVWALNNPDEYGTGNFPNHQYQSPETERLSADYDQLQDRLTEGYTAPIDRARARQMQQSNQDMSDRGIYTSLNAIRANNSVDEGYIPQYAQAGANATNARYQLEAGDIAAANAAKMENANRTYEAKWRPEDYKAGVWNGTGGVVSSGKTGGWSI